MKEFRKEPETDEKLTERSFMRSIAVCVISMILCMSFLASTTWAWYTGTITSAGNVIEISNYQIGVTVIKTDNDSEQNVEAKTDGSYLLEAGSYQVTLKALGTASTGYCKIVVSGNTYYYTEPLYYTATGGATESTVQNDGVALASETTETKKGSITISLTLEECATVKFIPCWGTYSGTDVIADNAAITITSAAQTDSDSSFE